MPTGTGTGPTSIVAQAAADTVCAVGDTTDWVCTELLDATGSELLARASLWLSSLVTIVVVLVVAVVVSKLAGRAITRFTRRMEGRIQQRLDRAVARGAIPEAARFRTRRLQRLHAISGVLRGVVGVAVWTIAAFLVIAELGVPLQPILAGAGLVGIVLGFGAQQLVRDVLAGIAMLIEDQYGVGDWIEVEGKVGQVERVGLRSTAFRDIDGTVHHVLNGYIQRVGNRSQEWARATLDVPVALDADIPTVKALINKVATDLVEDAVWGEDIIGSPEIWGVQAFGPEGVEIRVVIPTKPLRNWDVMRQLRERLKFAFDQAHIRMPSRFVEIGGQHMGYPLLQRDVTGTDERSHRQHRGLVPPDVGPLDRPPARTPGPRPSDEVDGTVGAGGPAEASPADDTGPIVPPTDDRDATRALRIQRGPEARPD